VSSWPPSRGMGWSWSILSRASWNWAGDPAERIEESRLATVRLAEGVEGSQDSGNVRESGVAGQAAKIRRHLSSGGRRGGMGRRRLGVAGYRLHRRARGCRAVGGASRETPVGFDRVGGSVESAWACRSLSTTSRGLRVRDQSMDAQRGDGGQISSGQQRQKEMLVGVWETTRLGK
jgi:hypothetical protein